MRFGKASLMRIVYALRNCFAYIYDACELKMFRQILRYAFEKWIRQIVELLQHGVDLTR